MGSYGTQQGVDGLCGHGDRVVADHDHPDPLRGGEGSIAGPLVHTRRRTPTRRMHQSQPSDWRCRWRLASYKTKKRTSSSSDESAVWPGGSVTVLARLPSRSYEMD